MLKKFFRTTFFWTTSPPPPPPPSPKNFRSGYHFRGLKIFGGHKRLLKKYKTQIEQILRDHLRSAPAPGYNFPHPHLYFVLFCAPGSHFTHPHLFHLSFPHPRSRRKVPYSAVWFVHNIHFNNSFSNINFFLHNQIFKLLKSEVTSSQWRLTLRTCC